MRIRNLLPFVRPTLILFALTACGLLLVNGTLRTSAGENPEWAMNATLIEACSCDMFCPCYFNPEPTEHAGHEGHDSGHFCRFNNAFQVNKGHFGDVSLDGIKFWVAGDLGGDFSEGKMDWAVLTFDRQVSEKQREGVLAVLPHLYPVEWNSFTVAEDAAMKWQAGKDRSVATLDDGKTAEVVLKPFRGMTDDPVVIHNLPYWGAPRNDGFVMMPNEVEAYRAGERPFEYGGGNGFMITVDINSSDVSAGD